MDIIGIICEYNPFHNGHAYHIKKIKELYQNSLIILVLNGYFLERGEISIINKENKTKIALENGIDIVIELPFVFGSNSADTFAETSINLLNYLKVNKIVFGSELNDVNKLTDFAKKQLDSDFNSKFLEHLNTGINYPTALNKSIGTDLNTPNDLLGISYIKAILKNNWNIEPVTIKRTNNYHDLTSNNQIISASNIRNKINNKESVNKYTNYSHLINTINEELLFQLLKYKIITDNNLNQYLTVDEGIENKLKKVINNVKSIDELILKTKSKRYTYNRIQRMLIHILIGLTKNDRSNLKIEYIKLLGFNQQGMNYLNKIKKDISIPIQRKISDKYIAQQYELKASLIYDLLTNDNSINYELNNKPIKKSE